MLVKILIPNTFVLNYGDSEILAPQFGRKDKMRCNQFQAKLDRTACREDFR